MKFSLALFAAASAELPQEFYERRLVIVSHFERLRDATLDLANNKKDARYYNKFNDWLVFIDGARNEDGTRCGEEVDDADDIQVFSADDYCKLNSQLNSAMSSLARQWACNGRGNVARQAVRRLKKLKNQYARRHCA
ncbi:Oidioi.mRNA.OKI2018_I69.PAR.g11494.t1.cds [Oikopleura dioica]|uniref:Oidioi.mRNA.OKI2018_I69.PAR.g11494.t1.cds n=1 Tax=Oikopleura dioica TaxID=34765 RepID=A0ABN7S007_OIKDI|nr:Oidioi.mRNA.OKI2018_I69.PAR.g11494.t1.cds [Oikopleura dioica]